LDVNARLGGWDLFGSFHPHPEPQHRPDSIGDAPHLHDATVDNSSRLDLGKLRASPGA
jgi:hypothetical protein